MKNIRYYILLSITLLSATCMQAVSINLDSLTNALDDAIEKSSEYEHAKLDRVDMIKAKIKTTKVSDSVLYELNKALFNEYESYICDSARVCMNRNIAIATKLGRFDLLDYARIKKAQVLSVSGLYLEAFDLLSKVDKNNLSEEYLSQYYKTYADLYLYLAEYSSEEEFRFGYLDKMTLYQDTILTYSADSFLYYTTKASILMGQHKIDESKEMLESYLPRVNEGTRQYAIITSTLSFLSGLNNSREEQKMYLIMSALSDVKAVVKENKSLRGLAEMLYDDGEIARADNYMKISMEDANFYNARLRNVQASKMLPMIDKTYQHIRDVQRYWLITLLILVSILVLALLIAIGFVFRQMKKLNVARKAVVVINGQLTEANHVKEEYIGRFMGLCSFYIDNLEDYRKMLNKKVSNGKIEDLRATLKSSKYSDDVLKEFYKNFDLAFLNIYPDFVNDFNSLMQDDAKEYPKESGRLTTELRIFALIRLGISDSSKIADFLRYSITTIYTYRSKMRNKSLYPDDFEDKLMGIGTFSI